MRSSRQLPLRGLHFNLVSWSPPASVTPTDTTVVLVHGFADAAGSWDGVAPHLARAGHHVFAMDLRGFGESEWIGGGGYYHFFDYVADLDALVKELAPTRLAVVGHSMGGTVSSLYAGARPKHVHRLALLEGMGPPDNDPRYAPDRAAQWLDDLAGGGRTRAFASREDAMRRLAAQHPKVAPHVLEARAPHLLKEQADGSVAWRFDPLHRTTSPVPFYAAAYRAFAARVACPVLLVDGGPEGFHPEDEAERASAFKDVRTVALPGAGHMMHWTMPDELGAALVEFLSLHAPCTRGGRRRPGPRARRAMRTPGVAPRSAAHRLPRADRLRRHRGGALQRRRRVLHRGAGGAALLRHARVPLHGPEDGRRGPRR